MIAVIAHRGASAVKPENTIEAFTEARRLGADMVELDVRRTADGAMAVHHDADLADGRRLAGIDARDLPATVPLLDAALEACAGMGVNIEIKNWPADSDHDPEDILAPKVAALVVETGWTRDVVVSSFSLTTIGRVRAEEPAIATAWLTAALLDPREAVDRAAAGGHRGLHPHHRAVTAEAVDAAHAAGLFVNAWTVDDPETMRRLADLGVDGVVTNVPDLALEVLAPYRQ